MPQITELPEVTSIATGDKFYIVTNAGISSQIKAGVAERSVSPNKVVTVSSISGLKDLDITNAIANSRAYVKSYYDDYSDRGLGGGEFYWLPSSTAEDGGRYITPASNPVYGRWERLLNGAIPNPQMFGARGFSTFNGDRTFAPNSPDETVAIKRALSGCRFGWSAQLYFPAGRYRITDTLLWDAQQTHIFGDGCVNGTMIAMDTGIEKDILKSLGSQQIDDHNIDPKISTDPYVLQGTNDIPKISSISFEYAGAYHRDYVNGSAPYQNITHSCISITLPGETNIIDGISTLGGKYGIRIQGPQGPGLRLTNSTINAAGEASISLEGIVAKHPFPTWGMYTGSKVGTLTCDNCSTDYRGTNVSGFSFVKVHRGATPVINIKDLKVEGMYPNGIVDYTKDVDDGTLGSIKIDGLYWNQTESGPEVQKMTVVKLSPGASSVKESVFCNIQNLTLYGVDRLVTDNIAKDAKGNPFITYASLGRAGGTNQTQHVMTPFTYHSFTETGRTTTLEAYNNTSFINNNQPDDLLVSFEPTGGTGWYRIMEGNLSNSAILNYNLSISNFFEVHKLNVFSDKHNKDVELRSNSSHSYDNSNFNNKIITRARLFNSRYPVGPDFSTNPVFLDIFVNSTGFLNQLSSFPETRMIRVHYQRMNSPHGNYPNHSNLMAPIRLTGNLEAIYQDQYSRYAEIDLSKAYDRNLSNQVGTKILGTTLVQKDLHLYTNSNREVRLFDAGAIVIFNGNGANAAGDPVFVGGVLKNIVLTNSGNGGYSTSPVIDIVPMTLLNGTGAFASGQVIGGYIAKVHIISGGAGYGAGPSSNSVGHSLTGTQPNSIFSSHIVDSNITTAKINDSAITTAKINDSAITTVKILDNNITTAKIVNSSITSDKIADGSILAKHIDSTGISPKIIKDSVSSSVRRLIIQNLPSSPNDTVSITADEMVLKNTSGLSYLSNSPNINVKISNAGAGGLDNGAEGNSRWYGIWGIYNSGSNLVSGVLSRADGRNFNYQGASSSDATYGFGPLMPSNYSYKALLGHVYNDTAGNFNTFLSQDRRTYINDTILFSSKAVTTINIYQFYQTGLGDNSLNITGVIPKNSIKLFGNIGGSINDGYGLIAIAATSGGIGANVYMGTATNNSLSLTGSIATWYGSSSYEIPLTGQGFWWKSSDIGLRNIISVGGYEI